jgi:hypothetical protein
MELYVIRKHFKDTYTIGNLLNGDKFLCNSLEDKIRDLQDINHDGDFDDDGEGKVYGQTAIPCGRYRVLVTDSSKLRKRLPILLNVTGFTGIRIHGGKNASWSEGCILVGENKVKGGLTNYEYWETVITQMIDDTIKAGEQVFITIKN